MLNSASTILTIDLYKRHLRPDADQKQIVRYGRFATAGFVVIACLWAPVISQFEGVFIYIQKVWGFITPGIVTVFVIGLLVKKAPPVAASGAMVLGVPIYALLLWFLPEVAFLHHMAITFLLLTGFMLVMTKLKPLDRPVTLPVVKDIETASMKAMYPVGSLVILLTVVLYIIFW
jgi:SSS family solute:Na+ symporter